MPGTCRSTCAWSILDEKNPPKYGVPELSTTYFSNGYPGGAAFRHYTCVPNPDDASSSSSTSMLSFGMMSSVSSADVTWSVERNGAVLDCREFHDDHIAPFEYLDDYILTPLDGSCLHPPTGSTNCDHSSASSMALLAVAVYYSGGGGEEGQGRQSPHHRSAGGTVCESDSSLGSDCVDDDDDGLDEGDCGP
jgi:hypothetical protein